MIYQEDDICSSIGSGTRTTWSISTARPSCQLEKTLRFPGLQEAAEALRDNPNPEGYTIKGPKRTCGRLFVPDLTFGKHIEMGENVFFYMGEMAECYVIYWPGKPVTEVHHGEM